MKLSDISIKRPVFAIVMSAMLVIFGLVSFQELSIRQMPQSELPFISINTVFPGASAKVVERSVTQIIESGISGVSGLKVISSTSRDEVSTVNMEFELDKDIDVAANEVREKLTAIIDRLPLDIKFPTVAKADPSQTPVMWIGMRSDRYDALELTDYIKRNLQDRFSALPGVAAITIGGAREYAMRVWIDRELLTARQLVIDDVIAAIQKENVELPAGRIESLNREFPVKFNSLLRTQEDFERLIISQSGDSVVRLADVARVEMGQNSLRKKMYANGIPTVAIGVVQQADASILEMAEAVHAEVEKIKLSLPTGMEMLVLSDGSEYIQASINEVLTALFGTLTVVVILIYFFFGSIRAAFIPAVAIPVSIIATLSVLYLFGFSINILTLLALVLAIGLVVDDAIVVVENIHRRIEKGEQAMRAAILGARQIAFAVIATTIVLTVVFVPLSFANGGTGRLFAEFGIALAAAVIFSSFIALSLTPMMCSRLLSTKTLDSDRLFNRVFARINDFYSKLVEKTQSVYVLVLFAGLLISLAAIYVFNQLPQEVAPQEDQGLVSIIFSGPNGASLEYMEARSNEVFKIVSPYLDSGEAVRFISILAPGFGGPGVVTSGYGGLRLVDKNERDKNHNQIAGELMHKLSGLPGIRGFAFGPSIWGGGGGGAAVQLLVKASTFEEADNWAEKLVELARNNPSLVNIRKSFEENNPELQVDVIRDRVGDMGVSTSSIASTLEALFGAKVVSHFSDRNELYEVIVQVESRQRITPDDLTRVHVRSQNNTLIPLSNLIEVRETSAVKSYTRVDRMPTVTVSAGVIPGYPLGDAVDYMVELAKNNLPGDVQIGYGGKTLTLKENSQAMTWVFLLAILLVFLTLAAQFENWVHPIIIMLTIPIALTGGLLALLLSGVSLNIFSQIGLLLLVGLIAKNGILVVEFANQLQEEGLSVDEAILSAAKQRFRPVVMTTLSTMFGAIPLLMSSGAGSENRQALAVAVLGGIGFATLITLFLIPALYKLFVKVTGRQRTLSEDAKRALEGI